MYYGIITGPLILLPIPVLQLGAMVLACGIVFAPVGSVVCALIARKRELSIWRYALAGAVHSALMLLPLLYLIKKMQGKPMQAETVTWGIRVAYFVWLSYLISQGALLVTPLESQWPPWDSRVSPYPTEVLWLVWWWLLIVQVVSVSCFVMSVLVLKHRLSPRVQNLFRRHARLSRLIYYAPFVGTAAHILALAALAAYVLVPQIGWTTSLSYIRIVLE